MSRRVIVVLLLSLSLSRAGILPEGLGTVQRGPVSKPPLTDLPVWDEYGLAEAETATYQGKGKPFQATAWRLKDPTGSQAAFRWLRPPNARPGAADALAYTKFAATLSNGWLMTFGNYLLRFEGRAPELEELKLFLFQLPKVDQSALPPLLEFVPADQQVPGSDRYVLGPASLEKFYPKVAPSTAAFHYGTEAVVARYKGRSSEVEMALFYYPTNQMARERQAEFEKIAGAMVKRSGPLLAAVIGAKNADDAERVLSLVNYKANITINENNPRGILGQTGDLIVNSMILVGLLLLMCILAGLMIYGGRYMRRRFGGVKDEDPMTLLHLEDR
ncbi:MAG: hypothetical protein NZV14_01420 [Bryobacteraceae bacterium]|nr:hypothetical protein [Bryobacteraceae bacterium]MDW8376789.1 DUF6599 family protein [Bryobacterales bacterium]